MRESLNVKKKKHKGLKLKTRLEAVWLLGDIFCKYVTFLLESLPDEEKCLEWNRMFEPLSAGSIKVLQRFLNCRCFTLSPFDSTHPAGFTCPPFNRFKQVISGGLSWSSTFQTYWLDLIKLAELSLMWGSHRVTGAPLAAGPSKDVCRLPPRPPQCLPVYSGHLFSSTCAEFFDVMCNVL